MCIYTHRKSLNKSCDLPKYVCVCIYIYIERERIMFFKIMFFKIDVLNIYIKNLRYLCLFQSKNVDSFTECSQDANKNEKLGTATEFDSKFNYLV